MISTDVPSPVVLTPEEDELANEIAVEVVRAMFLEKLNKYTGFNWIMTLPKYRKVFIDSSTILQKVAIIFETYPSLRDQVTWYSNGVPRYKEKITPKFWTHADATHDADAKKDSRR